MAATPTILSAGPLTTGHAGQIVLPDEIQQQLGVHPGDQVEFVLEHGKTIVRPAARPGDPFAEFVGALPAFGSLNEINAWVRDMRGRESDE